MDSGWTEVAEAKIYQHAYELVMLVNAAYKLMSDLSRKPRNEHAERSPRNLGLSTTEPGISDPPKPTALETVIELKKQYDPYVLLQNPLPFPQLLMTPAFIGSLASGQDAIFLDDVSGNLDLSHGKQPAYVFSNFVPPSGGGTQPPGNTPFSVGFASAGSQSGSFTGINSIKATTPKTGVLQSLSAFTDSSGVSVALGLYADNAGAPGALLASSAIVSSVVGTTTGAVAGGPTLPAGNYWVAFLSLTNCNCRLENTGGSAAFFNSQAWNGGALPNPFPVGFSTGPYAFSFYATFLG